MTPRPRATPASPTPRPRDDDEPPPPPSSDELIPDCERGDPAACGAGEECDIVIRRAPSEASFVIYPGCVERRDQRSLGAPCEPWGGFALSYSAEGLEDEVHTDPCAEGLFCAPDPEARGANTCQPACQPGRYRELTLSYPRSDQYWVGTSPDSSIFQEVCRSADACDPAGDMGCGPGQGCFLRLNQVSQDLHAGRRGRRGRGRG